MTIWRWEKAFEKKGFNGLLPDTDKCGRKSALQKLGLTRVELDAVIEECRGLNLDTGIGNLGAAALRAEQPLPGKPGARDPGPEPVEQAFAAAIAAPGHSHHEGRAPRASRRPAARPGWNLDAAQDGHSAGGHFQRGRHHADLGVVGAVGGVRGISVRREAAAGPVAAGDRRGVAEGPDLRADCPREVQLPGGGHLGVVRAHLRRGRAAAAGLATGARIVGGRHDRRAGSGIHGGRADPEPARGRVAPVADADHALARSTAWPEVSFPEDPADVDIVPAEEQIHRGVVQSQPVARRNLVGLPGPGPDAPAIREDEEAFPGMLARAQQDGPAPAFPIAGGKSPHGWWRCCVT